MDQGTQEEKPGGTRCRGHHNRPGSVRRLQLLWRDDVGGKIPGPHCDLFLVGTTPYGAEPHNPKLELA